VPIALPDGAEVSVGRGRSEFLLFVSKAEGGADLVRVTLRHGKPWTAKPVAVHDKRSFTDGMTAVQLSDGGWLLVARPCQNPALTGSDAVECRRRVGDVFHLRPDGKVVLVLEFDEAYDDSFGIVGEQSKDHVILVSIEGSGTSSQWRYWDLDIASRSMRPTAWQPPPLPHPTEDDSKYSTPCMVHGELLVLTQHAVSATVTGSITTVTPDHPKSARTTPFPLPSAEGTMICNGTENPMFWASHGALHQTYALGPRSAHLTARRSLRGTYLGATYSLGAVVLEFGPSQDLTRQKQIPTSVGSGHAVGPRPTSATSAVVLLENGTSHVTNIEVLAGDRLSITGDGTMWLKTTWSNPTRSSAQAWAS
jgi:hypothetical protein